MTNSDNENKNSANQNRDRKAFASKLKEAREKIATSQRGFWELMRDGHTDIHEKTMLNSHVAYNQYERAINFPSIPELRLLAYYCNVPTDELLGMYDIKFFYRLIKEKYPQTVITTTKQPLARDKWSNESEKELQIIVPSPTGAKYSPNIEELEKIRKECWDYHQADLKEQIFSHLERELPKERCFSKDLLELFKMLPFLFLNEILKEPLIESSETAASAYESAYESYSSKIKNNVELYKGCFQSNINNAIYFHLMTNIDPSKDNRIPSYLKLYALKQNIEEKKISILPPNINPDILKKIINTVFKDLGLQKRFATDNADPYLSHLRDYKLLDNKLFDNKLFDNKLFDNVFYRCLFILIKDFVTNSQDNQLQLKKSSELKQPGENLTTLKKMIKLLLDKLVEEGRYKEDGQWIKFINYRPNFNNKKLQSLTQKQNKLAQELNELEQNLIAELEQKQNELKQKQNELEQNLIAELERILIAELKNEPQSKQNPVTLEKSETDKTKHQ